MFTVKQLLNELQKERYDEKHLPVVIVIGEAGQEIPISSVKLAGEKVYIIADNPVKVSE